MKKSIYLLSLAILLFSMFGTASCSSLPKSSIDHPFGLFYERRLSQFSELPVSSDAVVFLGDSLTDEGRWSEIFPELKIFNRGVSADRTEHVLARLDQITKGHPKIIFIMIGTNDLKFGISPEKIISNYREILQSIQKQSPNTKVFVQSLLPRKASFQKHIEKINHDLLLLSKHYGCTYIDLYPAFLDKNGAIKKEYSNDALHLLGAGYLKWKELLDPYILDRRNN